MATEITVNLYNTIGEAYAAFKNGDHRYLKFDRLFVKFP